MQAPIRAQLASGLEFTAITSSGGYVVRKKRAHHVLTGDGVIEVPDLRRYILSCILKFVGDRTGYEGRLWCIRAETTMPDIASYHHHAAL